MAFTNTAANHHKNPASIMALAAIQATCSILNHRVPVDLEEAMGQFPAVFAGLATEAVSDLSRVEICKSVAGTVASLPAFA